MVDKVVRPPKGWDFTAEKANLCGELTLSDQWNLQVAFDDLDPKQESREASHQETGQDLCLDCLTL